MPELPEIETIKNQLDKLLIGHKIEKVEIKRRKSFPAGENNLIGGKIIKTRRFGKVIVIDLDNNYSILIHLKLTGQLIYRGPNLKNPPQFSKRVFGGVPGTHTQVIFHLDRNGFLYFNDFRGFGWIKVVKTEDVEKTDFINKLGPDALYKFSLSELRKITSKTKRAIKALLMDQSKISGIGNIYANDALFLAGIDPRRESNSLRDLEREELYKSIKKVLEDGLKYHGASELSYVTPDGMEGKYQNHFLVYGKEGKDCPNKCGGKIEKIKLGGRGTYFCPKCQK